jgi:hypothetical protein
MLYYDKFVLPLFMGTFTGSAFTVQGYFFS